MNKFNYNSLEDLKKDITKFKLDIPVNEELDSLKESVTLNATSVLSNRLAIHPMEGSDANQDGTPSELTKRRYKRFARGGAGLIWFEAVAINDQGRANKHQLFINETTVESFSDLVQITREEARENHSSEDSNPYLVLQLTHSGRFGDNKTILFHDKYLDNITGSENDCHILSDREIERLKEDYITAAKLAKEAGFDAVDIKSCHRYLLSEMLAAHTREGKYGGSYENRTRFLKNVIKEINKEVDIDLSVRLNVFDAIPYPYGWATDEEGNMDLDESRQLVRELSELGVDLFNVTASTPYLKPYMNRPYDQGRQQPPEHPLQGVYRLLYLTKMIQQEIKDSVVVGTGFSWLRELAPYIAAGMIEKGWAKVIGFGRQAFAYPDFAHDILFDNSLDPEKVCITCSKCAELKAAKKKCGCVIRDQEVYLPFYQELIATDKND
ncbi:NADH:flavin oxidoreductase [Halanaerocella petrolearia]